MSQAGGVKNPSFTIYQMLGFVQVTLFLISFFFFPYGKTRANNSTYFKVG